MVTLGLRFLVPLQIAFLNQSPATKFTLRIYKRSTTGLCINVYHCVNCFQTDCEMPCVCCRVTRKPEQDVAQQAANMLSVGAKPALVADVLHHYNYDTFS